MNRFGEILRKGWRGVKNQAGIMAAGVALLGLFFLIGLHLFFPVTAVQRWLVTEISSRSPVSLQVETLSLRPPFTLSGRNAVMSFANNAQPPVVLEELRLRPLWTSLLGGDPGLALTGSLLQGRIDAEFRSSGHLTLQIDGVTLSDVPLHQEARALFSGVIHNSELRGSFPARKGTENLLSVQLDKCVLTVMGQPLALGTIVVRGKAQGNNLRLDSLSANGGEATVSGSGNLLLGATVSASRINLDMTLRLAPSAPPTLAALFELAGKRQADNSYRLKLSGSPGQLTAEPMAPLRQPGTVPDEDNE